MTDAQLVKEGLDNAWCTLHMAGGADTDPDDKPSARLQVKLRVKGKNTVDLAGINIQPFGDQIGNNTWNEPVFILGSLKNRHQVSRHVDVFVYYFVGKREVYF